MQYSQLKVFFFTINYITYFNQHYFKSYFRFHEFVFEIVVDRKFCSKEILDVFDLEPKVLPAWDPMGALAR